MEEFLPMDARRMFLLKSDFEMFHYIDEDVKEVSYHYHDFFEIYFFIDGAVTYHVNGNIYTPKPGDIILLNDRMPHRLKRVAGGNNQKYERKLIWIDPDFILNNSWAGKSFASCFEPKSSKICRPLRLPEKERKEIDTILHKLEQAYFRNDYGNDVLRIIYFIELLVFINKAQLTSGNQAPMQDISYDPEINMVLEYIYANIDGDLSLDTIAEDLALDKFYLMRKFKQRMGMSTHKYIKQMRLVMAVIY